MQPQALTEKLQKAGVLPDGEVTAVSVQPVSTHYAKTAVLHLSYSPNATPTAPRSLFLKVHEASRGWRETAVYQAIRTQSNFPPITIPWYEASYDAQSGQSVCLLADYSQSHELVASREAVRAFVAAPTLVQLEATVEALAQWHAFWWEHPILQSDWVVVPSEFKGERAFRPFLIELQTAWQRFASQVGEKLPAVWCRKYEALLQILPQVAQKSLFSRFGRRRQLTLAHGDCYFGNFFYPRNESSKDGIFQSKATLFDFDNIHLNHVGEDLVLLLATFWTREQRRQYEHHLLRHYYVRLCAAGVTNYSQKDLERDYRLGIIWRLFHPTWGMLGGEAEAYWRTKLTCLMNAFEDWECASMF